MMWDRCGSDLAVSGAGVSTSGSGVGEGSVDVDREGSLDVDESTQLPPQATKNCSGNGIPISGPDKTNTDSTETQRSRAAHALRLKLRYVSTLGGGPLPIFAEGCTFFPVFVHRVLKSPTIQHPDVWEPSQTRWCTTGPLAQPIWFKYGRKLGNPSRLDYIVRSTAMSRVNCRSTATSSLQAKEDRCKRASIACCNDEAQNKGVLISTLRHQELDPIMHERYANTSPSGVRVGRR